MAYNGVERKLPFIQVYPDFWPIQYILICALHTNLCIYRLMCLDGSFYNQIHLPHHHTGGGLCARYDNYTQSFLWEMEVITFGNCFYRLLPTMLLLIIVINICLALHTLNICVACIDHTSGGCVRRQSFDIDRKRTGRKHRRYKKDIYETFSTKTYEQDYYML